MRVTTAAEQYTSRNDCLLIIPHTVDIGLANSHRQLSIRTILFHVTLTANINKKTNKTSCGAGHNKPRPLLPPSYFRCKI